MDRTLNPGSAIWNDTRITDREPFPAQMKDTRIPANFNRWAILTSKVSL